MARGSRGRSSGRPFIMTPGSSSFWGVRDDHELSYQERRMRLPLEQRCQELSELYAKSIKESNVSLAIIRKNRMVGCSEKYFDVDSIAKRILNMSYVERNRLAEEKELMSWPLELRCSSLSEAYAQGIRESEPHLADMCKKLMVGCPGKYFDVAMSSNTSVLERQMRKD